MITLPDFVILYGLVLGSAALILAVLLDAWKRRQ